MKFYGHLVPKCPKWFFQFVVPDAQLYIIPYPPESPDSWKLKLFVTINKNLILSAATLGVACLILIILVCTYIVH